MSDKYLIKRSWAYPILDSMGFPTIEIVIELKDGTIGRGAAPKGSTVGEFECVQKKDIDGLCEYFNRNIANKLKDLDVSNIFEVDEFLIDMDGTDNKSNLGGNLTLAVSIAALEAASISTNKPIYQLINPSKDYKRPLLMFNLLDGTKESLVPGVECLLVEKNPESLYNTLNKASFIQKELGNLIVKEGGITAYGNQGSCVEKSLKNPEGMMEKVNLAMTNGDVNDQFKLGLDLATSDSYTNGLYNLTWSKHRYSDQLYMLYKEWIKKYNLIYLEDLFSDTDYQAWGKHHSFLTNGVMVAGDDLYASNPKRIKEYSDLANAIVIKPNQIGTIKETVESIQIAKELNMKVIISQRTSEIENNIITHLAVACGADYLKAGGLRRLDRLGKYNELIRIFAG